ncbi:MAG: dephospho-CoA kinase [Proteobacteria bacterium]|nr:dephospho-CoA kinase [Pseudomonadota bacterium]
MFRLGMTGSIGTGKSTTAAMFRAHGVPVHDADAAVREVYAGEAVDPVGKAFPGVISDGKVDRKLLAAQLKAAPERFAELERIVHPLVHAVEQRAIAAAARAGSRLILLDIPLLFETRAERRCDAVLVTVVAPEEQKRRVLARPGMDEALFHAILARQMPMAEKCRHAHAIIDTGSGFEAARHEVAALLRALAAVAT